MFEILLGRHPECKALTGEILNRDKVPHLGNVIQVVLEQVSCLAVGASRNLSDTIVPLLSRSVD